MLDSAIDHVVSALKVKKDKIESKGIKSIRSRVANISEFLDDKMTADEFKKHLLHHIFNTNDLSEVPEYKLTDEDWKVIRKISEERYQNWDWNFGRSPAFNLQHSKRYPVGSIDLRLEVKKGIIQDCKIFGDFFGAKDVSEIEQALTGKQYDRTAIREALAGIDLKQYFGKIELEDFLELIY
jgi:lipoate-protein ligase A